MYNEVVKLIAESKTTNEYGDTVVVESERQVFAQLKSIGQSEFYQAQAVGLKPEIKFVLPDFLEYNGEDRLRYTPFGGEETTYSIIRTFRNNNELELVCNRGIQ